MYILPKFKKCLNAEKNLEAFMQGKASWTSLLSADIFEQEVIANRATS